MLRREQAGDAGPAQEQEPELPRRVGSRADDGGDRSGLGGDQRRARRG